MMNTSINFFGFFCGSPWGRPVFSLRFLLYTHFVNGYTVIYCQKVNISTHEERLLIFFEKRGRKSLRKRKAESKINGFWHSRRTYADDVRAATSPDESTASGPPGRAGGARRAHGAAYRKRRFERESQRHSIEKAAPHGGHLLAKRRAGKRAGNVALERTSRRHSGEAPRGASSRERRAGGDTPETPPGRFPRRNSGFPSPLGRWRRGAAGKRLPHCGKIRFFADFFLSGAKKDIDKPTDLYYNIF